MKMSFTEVNSNAYQTHFHMKLKFRAWTRFETGKRQLGNGLLVVDLFVLIYTTSFVFIGNESS